MLRLLRFLLWSFARCVLPLRYRVRTHGLDELRSVKGPLLVLPNHPAFIDPPITLTWLWPVLKPRPLLFEGNFSGPLAALIPVMDAIRVPDLDQTSAEARERTEEALERLKAALRAGQNALVWPSGMLQRTGLERLGASRTVADVLRDVPEAQVVLVRTRGLFGSRFSYAYTGKRPRFVKRLLQGAGQLLANLVFFAPRRDVDVTVELVKREDLPGLDRAVLNPWLESWYNAPGKEAPRFVPTHFLFGPREREFPPVEEAAELDLSQVREETRVAVLEMVAEKIGRPLRDDEKSAGMHLDQLGMDSLERQELSLQVERRFGFTGDVVPATVGQLYALAAGLAQREPPKPPPAQWFQPISGSAEAAITGETIAEAFVARALACRKDVIVADDRSGVLTYERVLVGALIMARRFRELPGKNVGLLLPASAASDIAMMGLYLADKLPVVLNWTTGPANLAHAAKLMGLQHVVTSQVFTDRTGIQVEGTSYVFLEELRKQVGKFEALKALLTVRWLPGSVRKAVPRPGPDSPAVVLFTSGSEKAPKAVPLTHRNLLTNQRDGTEALKVSRADSLLGFLPAFHSFGLAITGIYPLVAGMRVVRHPDPTDAAALARKVGLYRPTILVGTPTFVSYILERAEPGELKSLRMVLVGAEKCPEAIVRRFAREAPACEVLEGYGVTECSPVVTVNPAGANRPGTVGRPLRHVELALVDPDTKEPRPGDQMGMLLVAGPTVFPGYLGEEKPPFLDRGGKHWYVTGDLATIDADGYVHFSGRLKRFLKVGGEMVSLPALEEPFAKLYPPTKDGPRVAVEGIEVEGGGRHVVLFSAEPVTLREANELLQKEGFHGVYRIDEVRKVDELPVLGTGKTDYKVLRAQIQAERQAAKVG